MPNPRADRTGAAERIADRVGSRNLEIAQQRCEVIAHRGEAHRPVRIRGAAVALHLDSDHRARLSRTLHPSLYLADCRQPARDQNQRFALAVDLVIELDAVRVSVSRRSLVSSPLPCRCRRSHQRRPRIETPHRTWYRITETLGPNKPGIKWLKSIAVQSLTGRQPLPHRTHRKVTRNPTGDRLTVGGTRRFCTHRASTDLTGLVVCVATTSTGFASFALFRKQNDLFQPPRSNGRRLAYQTGTAARIIGSEDRAMCLRPLPDRATTTAPCQALTKDMRFCLANAGV